MTIQHFHKNTIRHRKNNRWLQSPRNSDKPENDTKIKILKISRNCHKPSLKQGLEQLYKVTSCNEKCNFFILLKSIPLFRILLIGIIPLYRNGISRLAQLLNLLFCRRGFRSPILTTLLTRKIFHIVTLPNQWIRRIENDTKFVILINFCDLKKVAVNTV